MPMCTSRTPDRTPDRQHVEYCYDNAGVQSYSINLSSAGLLKENFDSVFSFISALKIHAPKKPLVIITSLQRPLCPQLTAHPTQQAWWLQPDRYYGPLHHCADGCAGSASPLHLSHLLTLCVKMVAKSLFVIGQTVCTCNIACIVCNILACPRGLLLIHF